jgi:hypothetical protein
VLGEGKRNYIHHENNEIYHMGRQYGGMKIHQRGRRRLEKINMRKNSRGAGCCKMKIRYEIMIGVVSRYEEGSSV